MAVRERRRYDVGPALRQLSEIHSRAMQSGDRDLQDQMLRHYMDGFMRADPGGMPVKTFGEDALRHLPPLAREMAEAHNRAINEINKLPPAQRDNALTELMRQYERMWDEIENRLQSQQPAPAQPPVRVVPLQAPRRVQRFVYDIRMDGRTYRLTLGERLPMTTTGRIDASAARRRLMEAMLNNQTTPLGGQIYADVMMTKGTNPLEAVQFNNHPGGPNYRMDEFRDRYLARTHRSEERDGEMVSTFVDDPAITVTRVAQRAPSRKERGG